MLSAPANSNRTSLPVRAAEDQFIRGREQDAFREKQHGPGGIGDPIDHGTVGMNDPDTSVAPHGDLGFSTAQADGKNFAVDHPVERIQGVVVPAREGMRLRKKHDGMIAIQAEDRRTRRRIGFPVRRDDLRIGLGQTQLLRARRGENSRHVPAGRAKNCPPRLAPASARPTNRRSLRWRELQSPTAPKRRQPQQDEQEVALMAFR